MSTFRLIEDERRERLAERGCREDDPQEIMNLRVLRDWVVKISVAMTKVGRMSKAMLVELEDERFKNADYDGPKQAAAIRQVRSFASLVLTSSGYGQTELEIGLDSKLPYNLMLVATSLLDNAIWDMGGEV